MGALKRLSEVRVAVAYAILLEVFRAMSAAGVERNCHFIGALKWGVWRVRGVWHSLPAQV